MIQFPTVLVATSYVVVTETSTDEYLSFYWVEHFSLKVSLRYILSHEVSRFIQASSLEIDKQGNKGICDKVPFDTQW